MPKSIRLTLACLAVLVAAPTAAAAGPPSILVKFVHPARGAATARALGDALAGETANGVAIVRLSPGESPAARVAAYQRRADVVFVEANARVHADALDPPDDPGYASQWALAVADALGGWALYPGAYGMTGGVPIAIVDTGVESTHPDLAGRVRTELGATCLTPEANPWPPAPCVSGPAADDQGHGTHVAGIAAAATNNGAGVAGLAFSSPIIPVKVLDESGAGWDSDIANGIVWAAQHGARVINLSLGGDYSDTVCDAVYVAEHSYGALIVAAAGNESWSTPVSPAGCPGAVGVAATDQLDEVAAFSNYGAPDVFVSAPGVDIDSTYPTNVYASLSGTSMASPFVAALAALRLGQYPASTPAAVREALASTTDKVGPGLYGPDPYETCAGCTWNDAYGYGRVDVARTLAASAPAPPPPPPPSPPPPPPPSPPPPPPPAPPSLPAVLPPPPPPRDTEAPFVQSYGAYGRRGVVIKLRYRVRDDHGATTERISVYRGRTLLRSFGRGLRQTEDAVAYWVAWRAPRRRMVGRFCVRAADAEGNRSTSCAAVRVR